MFTSWGICHYLDFALLKETFAIWDFCLYFYFQYFMNILPEEMFAIWDIRHYLDFS